MDNKKANVTFAVIYEINDFPAWLSTGKKKCQARIRISWTKHKKSSHRKKIYHESKKPPNQITLWYVISHALLSQPLSFGIFKLSKQNFFMDQNFQRWASSWIIKWKGLLLLKPNKPLMLESGVQTAYHICALTILKALRQQVELF